MLILIVNRVLHDGIPSVNRFKSVLLKRLNVLSTNPEVRSSEPACAVPSLAQGDEAEEISAVTVLCLYLPVCYDFLRLNLAVFTVFAPGPELKTNRGLPEHQRGMEPQGRDDLKGPVLHIVVVGFHHKKGCQVREPLLNANR